MLYIDWGAAYTGVDICHNSNHTPRSVRFTWKYTLIFKKKNPTTSLSHPSPELNSVGESWIQGRSEVGLGGDAVPEDKAVTKAAPRWRYFPSAHSLVRCALSSGLGKGWV